MNGYPWGMIIGTGSTVTILPTAPPHPSPEPIPGESDTTAPMARQTGAETNGEPHD